MLCMEYAKFLHIAGVNTYPFLNLDGRKVVFNKAVSGIRLLHNERFQLASFVPFSLLGIRPIRELSGCENIFFFRDH